MRKAERAKAWEAGSRRSKSGREGRAAAPGPGARPPTYKRTCHIVTVNASGGQINDKSNALEEKREKKKFEKLKFRYRPPTAHPRMCLGVPRGLPWAKSNLTGLKALLTHCPTVRH